MGGVRYSEVNLAGFHRIGSQIVCPLLGGVRYSEVNLEGFHRIGSQIVCPLLRGVRYSACPLFKGFTVSNRYLIFRELHFQEKSGSRFLEQKCSRPITV